MENYYDNPGILLNLMLKEDEESDFQFEFEQIQAALKKISVELRGTQEGSLDFIGAHPKSLSKTKLQQIKKEVNDWLVCEKTDGVRYLLIILNNGHCYLTGRNLGGLSQSNQFQLHLIKIKVPSQLIDLQKIEIIEMFDGELIVENFTNQKQALNYLIFDSLIHQGQNVTKLNYFDRLRCVQEYLQLRKFFKKLQPLHEVDFQPLKNFPKIRCILKDFFIPTQVRYIFQQYIPLLFHGNDGLIFTKNSIPYISGTNENIVKWKPPEKNTIDFLICPNTKIDLTDSNYGVLELYVMINIKKVKQLLFFDFVYVKRELIDEIQKEKSKIIDKLEEIGQLEKVKGVVAECKLERLNGVQQKIQELYNLANWGFDETRIENFFESILRHTEYAVDLDYQIKIKNIDLLKDIRESIHLKFNFKFTWTIEKYRSDKTFPNSYTVAQNLLQIIGEDLKQQELIEILEKQIPI